MKSLLHNGLAQAALMLMMGLCAGSARADEGPCGKFGWDITHERTLFAGKPVREKAGADAGSAPAIKPGHLYELALTAQDQVQFSAPPGKAPRTGGTYAGLAKLTVLKSGLYRISVDQPFWIDVAAGAELIHSTDYQGAEGCSKPGKIVRFVLPAAQEVVVQISGMQSPRARLTVTAEPATK